MTSDERTAPWIVDGLVAAALVLALAAVYWVDHRESSLAKAPAVDSQLPDETDETDDVPMPVIAPPKEFLEPPPPPPPEAVAMAEIPEPPPPPPPQIAPEKAMVRVDPVPRVDLQWSRSGRFGVMTTSGNPDDPSDDGKKLTFNERGATNNTRVFVDDDTPLFGADEPPERIGNGNWPDEPLQMIWTHRNIAFLQKVELTPGDASHRMDAVRVTYVATNRGSVPRRVGLRVMLDTLIGGNDGVPFIVPGSNDIVTAARTFEGNRVPDFVRALERPDLVSPGVIVDIGLRPSEGERPSQVVLGHWPGDNAAWDYDRRESLGNDSAVGLYYKPKLLPPGRSRTCQFTYGLGTISSTQSRNAKLSLTAGGPFFAGEPFWLVALVDKPQAGQQVRIELPTGASPAPGHEPIKSVTPGGNFAQLSWLVRLAPDCPQELVFTATLLPDDVAERYTIRPSSARARLVVRSKSPANAGGPHWVVAAAQNAAPGQSVRLTLPPGAAFASGHEANKQLETGNPPQAAWLVDLPPELRGEVAFRAQLDDPSGEPAEATQTVRVDPPVPRLTLVAGKPIVAGRPFWIAGLVQNPPPDAKLRLQLPDDVTLEPEHHEVQQLKATSPQCRVSWLVRPARSLRGQCAVQATLEPGDIAARCKIAVAAPTTRLTLVAPKPFLEGRRGWAVALIQFPQPGQRVRIELPAGLTLDEGQALEQPVPESEAECVQVAWKLVAAPRAAGKSTLHVSLEPGDLSATCTAEIHPGSVIH